jgi:hypothetical protein
MVVELPTGTVTLLFTDIEGSTRLLRSLAPCPPAPGSCLSGDGPRRLADRPGPGGRALGRVGFADTPADLVASSDSLTARHLRAYLERA